MSGHRFPCPRSVDGLSCSLGKGHESPCRVSAENKRKAEIDQLASANALLGETARTYTTMLLESRSERDIAETDLKASQQAYRELETVLDGHAVWYEPVGENLTLRDLVNDAMKERPEIVTRVGDGK